MKQRFKEIHQLCRKGADPEPLYRSWISWAPGFDMVVPKSPKIGLEIT